MIGKLDQHFPQLARPAYPLRKIQPQSFVGHLQVEAVGITPAAEPFGLIVRTEQFCRIEVDRVTMIGIEVINGALASEPQYQLAS